MRCKRRTIERLPMNTRRGRGWCRGSSNLRRRSRTSWRSRRKVWGSSRQLRRGLRHRSRNKLQNSRLKIMVNRWNQKWIVLRCSVKIYRQKTLEMLIIITSVTERLLENLSKQLYWIIRHLLFPNRLFISHNLHFTYKMSSMSQSYLQTPFISCQY